MEFRELLTPIWITLSAVLALVIHFAILTYRRRRFYRNLPGPPHSWLWGHLKVMGDMTALMPPNCHPQVLLTELTRHYDLPPIFYMDLWPAADPMCIVTDPAIMHQFQVAHPLGQHASAHDFLVPMIGPDVVAVVNGPKWKLLRSAMNPSFAPAHVKNLSPVIVEEALLFREALGKFADSKEAFDMEHVGATVIFDIIARIVFNFPLHAQTKGSQLLEDLRELITLVDMSMSLNPVEKLKVWWRQGQVRGRVNAEVRDKIRERYALLKAQKVVPSKKDPYSILDLMLREQLMRGDEVDELDPAYEELLVSNMKGLLLGGHGTTNDTLSFIYLLLSKHPEAVQKLREEHARVFSSDLDETLAMLSEDPYKLNQLDYTTSVIKEALRIFPVGFGVRVATPGATLTYNGTQYPIDNDQCVVALAHHAHYNENFFPEPTEFKPERFLDDNIEHAAFRTFSRGPRACAGQGLAIDELRAILLLTVGAFDFEYVGGEARKERRTRYTDLDLQYGDVVFQELGMSAKPRVGLTMMKVRRAG